MSRPVDIDNSKAEFRLRLLGLPSLTDRAGAPVAGMGPGKPLALLAYLVFHPRVRRDELIALLWGDVAEAKARNAFRQTLHRLRSALGEAMLPSAPDHIVLEAGDKIWCDALAFQTAVSEDDTDRAIELYGGKFLEGLELGEEGFDDWLDERRRKFSAAYEGVLSRSAERALDSGDWRLAVQHAQVLARLEPLDSQAAVLEATALLAGGRRAEAITALTVHTQRLQSELGTKPPPAVSSMLQSILSSSPRQGGSDPRIESDRPRFRQPEFVGRETELARLLAAWRRACGGEGSSVIVVGAAGVGKSRLVTEFLQRAPAIEAPLVLSGQERPAAVNIPYASVAEALRPALNAPGVSGASQHLLAEAARLLPELRDQFDLPTPAGLSDDTERVRFFEGIAALVDAVAYEQPACIILEDLQHASASTVELVRYLGRRLQKSPVLILATYSTNGQAGTRGALSSAVAAFDESGRSGDAFDRVEIDPLSLEECERLLDSALGAAEVSADDRRRLAALSAGKPLRLLELADRALEGDIVPAVPTTLHDVLWRRLQECTPHEQRLFVAAALFGQAVSIRLLAAAAHVSESAALEGVMRLERRGLLLQRDGKMTPANADAAALALQSTGAAGTALLAGWAADALAAERPSAAAELAQLYALAGRKPATYRFARVAALDAAACGAYDDAERFVALAISSAGSDTERADASALARSIGHGPKLLAGAGGGTNEARSADDEPTRAAQTEPAVATTPNTSVPQPITRRPWPEVKVRSWLWLAAAATVVAAVLVRTSLDDRARTRGNVLGDTLVLIERLAPRDVRYHLITGLLSNEVQPAPRAWRPANTPRWVDSLSPPWINPVPSPDARWIAVERVSARGVDVYVIDATARDTIPIAIGGGDNIVESWSPDGERLLVLAGRTLTDGLYDSDLFAHTISPASRIALDTGATRSVTEARWSPRGTDVAWVARDVDSRQQDVFVGKADGGRARNVSRHSAEDYDLAWSADGERVAFTSERDGNAEIYSAEIATGRLRRMTFDPNQDSRPEFSPDGQFLAFESFRTGRLQTYVMASLAGAPRSLAGVESRLEIVGWKGRAPSFVDDVSIRVRSTLVPGDSTIATAEARDQYGEEMSIEDVRWSSLNPVVLGVRAMGDSVLSRAVLSAERPGNAQIVAALGGWRSDTVLIHVGAGGIGGVTDSFESRALQPFWLPLGTPRPYVARGMGRGGTAGFVPNGDAQWESGVLGTTPVPLSPGLTIEAWVRAPFTAARPAARSFNISLVAPGPTTSLDSVSPQFLRHLSVSWLGDAARLSYSVEGEVHTEPVTAIGGAGEHVFRIVVEPAGRAAFYVDGRLRWRSNVILASAQDARMAQVWIGSRGTGDRVVVDDVSVTPAALRAR